jgi:hypothetical protein
VLKEQFRKRVTDPYSANSLSGRARQKRWATFLASFPELPDLSVLDLGGTAATWLRSEVRPHHVTCLNLPGVNPHGTADWIRHEVGDACAPDGADLAREHDLVFTNSVIEHVGGHVQRLAFADNVRAAERYWVQTPYRYFPVEPHWVFPGLQFLPPVAQAAVTRHWPVGWFYRHRDDDREVLASVFGVELLDQTQMRFYFPDGELLLERSGGLVKSLIALRSRTGDG